MALQRGITIDDLLRFLREHTATHVHADLIVGLPGETVAGFAAARFVRSSAQRRIAERDHQQGPRV